MAKTVQLAFFKAMYGSILSKTIKVVTRSIYSHVEIIIDDTWYGSNIDLLGTSGITKLVKPKIDPKEWKIITVKVTDKQYKELKEDANSLVGSGYAFMAALQSQFSIFSVNISKEFFCSQFVSYLLKKHHILNFNKKNVSKYDPGTLFRELTNKAKYTKKNIKKIEFSNLTKKSFSLEEITYRW